jgi:hypothetical protein
MTRLPKPEGSPGLAERRYSRFTSNPHDPVEGLPLEPRRARYGSSTPIGIAGGPARF